MQPQNWWLVLAAASPKSKITESVLTFLLPRTRKDPSRNFLSPMGFLPAMVVGAIDVPSHEIIYWRTTNSSQAVYIHMFVIPDMQALIWYTAQGSWLRESEVYKMDRHGPGDGALGFGSHSWKPPILQDAELLQNVMQDHKNLHLAKLLICK